MRRSGAFTSPCPAVSRKYRVSGSMPRFPVSVKGVVIRDGSVVLLRNDREEWELPGGRLEPGESPKGCLRREVWEELGLSVEVGALLHAWTYPVWHEREVFVVSYGCHDGGCLLYTSDAADE